MAQSKLNLHISLFVLRTVARLFQLLDFYLSKPRIPIQPTSKLKIPSTTSRQNGFIELVFYTNSKYPLGSSSAISTSTSKPKTDASPRPVIINFHGGGWVFGTPTMDARWAHRVVDELDSDVVFISVGYRLAPRHPYPTPIDDCIDAILWVHDHADEYRIDKNRIVISGFSAGGNMAFATALRLQGDRVLAKKGIGLAGIISFYPLLDRSISNEEKYRGNAAAAEHGRGGDSTLALYDICYLGGGDEKIKRAVDLKLPDLSPGLAPDDLLRSALPRKMAIFTCAWDRLLDEAEVFRKRLTALGKIVEGRVIEDVVHAWDRYPTFGKGNPKMDEMYAEATEVLKSMIREEES